MKDPIRAIDRKLIKQELSQETFLRYTCYGHREVHILTAHNAPYTMLEIGRLRELTFREAGGGTGKSVDIDGFDTMQEAYRQLIVWDQKEEELVGGYRFIKGSDVTFSSDGTPQLSTTEIFKFTPKFIKEELPTIIELGRSFVQPRYQSSRSGIFSLDNLWDGLGGLIYIYPDMKSFFGKVTMYEHFNKEARDVLLYFMQKYYSDKEQLVYPTYPLVLQTDADKLAAIFEGLDREEAYRTMVKRVRELGENVPPLFNSYIKLSPAMRTFGTAVNPHFGNVEETGILIPIDEIYDEKKDRHIPNEEDLVLSRKERAKWLRNMLKR